MQDRVFWIEANCRPVGTDRLSIRRVAKMERHGAASLNLGKVGPRFARSLVFDKGPVSVSLVQQNVPEEQPQPTAFGVFLECPLRDMLGFGGPAST